MLLSSRADDGAADAEYEAFLALADLPAGRLHRVRMEAGPVPRLDLDGYAGVFLGGGPFNSSDPPETKSPTQLRVERELRLILDEITVRDLPFFGACYGVGTLGVHQGGIVDRTYSEPVSCIQVSLTDEGRSDPVLAGVPDRFDAFVGHKEACRVLPPEAVLLATSPGCPVQMFRIKKNMYATQFHPELDAVGIVARVRVYRHAGYFRPDELESLVARLSVAVVTEPGRMLANFVARYS